jgi:putative MATE family efflux protein
MQRKILQLVWPVVLDLSWFMIVNILVTAMVGSFGAVALAAVGLSNMVQFSTAIVFAAAGTGAAAIVAREEGAKNWQVVRAVTGQALFLGFALGALLAVLGYMGVPYIFNFIDAEPEIAKLSIDLLKITFVGTPFYLMMSIGNAILRGLGKTKSAFWISFFSNGINLLLSYMLIYGWGLPSIGPYGVAWGIRLYQLVGGTLVIWILMTQTRMDLAWRDILVVKIKIIQRILDISVPAALEQLAMQGGRMAFTFMLVKVGAVQFAAHQIALQVESISFLPGFGFSVAAMTLVGQHLGKGMPHRAAQYAWMTNKIGLVAMTGMGFIFLLFSKLLTGLFINDPEVVYWGSLCVMLAALEQPTLAITYVLGGALRGAGDTKWPMYITTIGVWLVRIPLVYVFISVLKYNITAAWVITAGDFFIRSIIFWRRFSTNRWKSI